MGADAVLDLPSNDVVSFFKALADESRLTIVRTLVVTNLRAGELVTLLGQPQNAVSYHLKQLRQLGLLRDRRSSADARDVYYSVDHARLQALYLAAGDVLHARTPDTQPNAGYDQAHPVRILFLCTHNSARSQIAEALARQLGGGQVEAFSAGNQPTHLHPMTVETLHEIGIDPQGHTSKLMDQFVDQEFDYVITVCDRARESCPTFPGDPVQIHWSFLDPAAIDDEGTQRQAFRTIRRELDTRLRYLLSLPHPRTGQRMRLPLRTEGERQAGA
jgi:protein-tyrosine-phosphatase/DNA-binding transcriptional ArsR family regulator